MNYTPARFRRRPAEIEAVQWTDQNADELRAFAGQRFDTIAPEDRTDDPDATASLIESAHESWALLVPGDWVVKRVDDFAVLTPEEFADLYEPVAGDPARREQIRRAIAEADGFNYEHLEPHDYQQHADAILALPAAPVAPANRAAIYHECAERLRSMREKCKSTAFRVAYRAAADQLDCDADEIDPSRIADAQQPEICELPHLTIAEEDACEQARLDARPAHDEGEHCFCGPECDEAGEADHA